MSWPHWEVLDPPGFAARLPLAQSAIDLDVAGRSDAHCIDRVLSDPATRVMFVRGSRVAVLRGEGLRAPRSLGPIADPAAPRLDAFAPAAHSGLVFAKGTDCRASARREGALAVYLGREGRAGHRVHYVAVDVSRHGEPFHTGHGSGGLSVRIDAVCGWVELRSFAPCASPLEAGLAASAVAICSWHASQHFCPACGSPTRPILGGWAQECTNPADDGRQLFPRIEPAVITAIIDDDDRILLQHNRAWRPRFFSVSAGFVEAGESLEHAVRREAAEEVGVALGEVSYLASQPWPFPASIMLGFIARALTCDIAVDGDEVESARWFSRSELAAAVESGVVEPPGRASIARHMIEFWLGHGLV